MLLVLNSTASTYIPYLYFCEKLKQILAKYYFLPEILELVKTQIFHVFKFYFLNSVNTGVTGLMLYIAYGMVK